jgi:hypothetical protein
MRLFKGALVTYGQDTFLFLKKQAWAELQKTDFLKKGRI